MNVILYFSEASLILNLKLFHSSVSGYGQSVLHYTILFLALICVSAILFIHPVFILVLYLICNSSQLSWKACHKNRQVKQGRGMQGIESISSQSVRTCLGGRPANQITAGIPFRILLLWAI